jgi:hypothetical protein
MGGRFAQILNMSLGILCRLEACAKVRSEFAEGRLFFVGMCYNEVAQKDEGIIHALKGHHAA